MPEHSDLSLVVLLHLQLVLLELIDLIPYEFHFLDLLCDLAFDLFRRPTLTVEFGAKSVEDLIEAVVWLPRSRRAQVGVATMLCGVEHSGRCIWCVLGEEGD